MSDNMISDKEITTDYIQEHGIYTSNIIVQEKWPPEGHKVFLEKLEPKTKNMVSLLQKLQLKGKKNGVLLVTPRPTKDFDSVVKSSRNIEGVSVTASNLLNTYEVLRARKILLMKESVDVLKETYIK